MRNQMIQQEILYKLNAKVIGFYGLPTVTDIVDNYVVDLPRMYKKVFNQDFKDVPINKENVNFWANDVLGILGELDMQAADYALLNDQY